MPADEAEALADLGQRLARERPIPRPVFRGELTRSLFSGGGAGARPKRLRLLIAAYGGSGAAMLAIAAAGLVGLGPFAP